METIRENASIENKLKNTHFNDLLMQILLALL